HPRTDPRRDAGATRSLATPAGTPRGGRRAGAPARAAARLARGDRRRGRGRDAGRGSGSGALPHRLRPALMVRRRSLLAYLIGAGVAGTMLIGPYGLRFAVINHLPGGATIGNVPFFLLPVAWGLWNLLRVHWLPGFGIGAWGATLGVAVG